MPNQLKACMFSKANRKFALIAFAQETKIDLLGVNRFKDIKRQFGIKKML